MQAVLRAGCKRWDITVYKPKMVSLALLLLTVSTLATHGNALPSEQAITHECEGRTLCGVKPAGYPQEEIDRLVLQQLPYLHRMKRQAPSSASMEPDSITRGGNCAMGNTSTPVYTIKRRQGLPELVVQSKWFSQTITEVYCLNDPSMESGCFSSLANVTPLKTKCLTKYMHTYLTIYDIEKKELVESPAQIGVDCVCVISE